MNMTHPDTTFPHSALSYVRDRELASALLATFQQAEDLTKAVPNSMLVLVSRRAACVYEMLVQTRMIPRFTWCDVVSDRLFDTRTTGFVGRHAVLVDDTLVLGSTLLKRFVELVGLVGDDLAYPSRVSVLVACVDSERHSPVVTEKFGLGRPEAAALWRSTDEVHEFSRDLAQCLYMAQIPYFTDFPVSKTFRTSRLGFDRLLSTRKWTACQLSVKEFSDDSFSVTFFPSPEVRERFLRRVVPAAGVLSGLMKIRVFVSSATDDEVDFRIVPIAVPVPALIDRVPGTINSIAQAITPHRAPTLNWDRWLPAAQHRLVQMYLSTCLLSEFWSELEQEIRPEALTIAKIQTEPLEAYFGPEYYPSVARSFGYALDHYNSSGDLEHAPAILEALRERVIIVPTDTLRHDPDVERAALSMEMAELLAPVVKPEPGEPFKLDQVWAQPLLHLFHAIARYPEKEQEDSLRRLGWQDLVDYVRGRDVTSIGPRVLEHGLTLDELAQLLAGDAGDPEWIRMVASLALDIGNDLGVAVPVTVTETGGDAVYRVYRTGENAHLVEAEYSLLGLLDANVAFERLDRVTRTGLALPNLTWNELQGCGTQFETFKQWHRKLRKRTQQSPVKGRLIQLWIGEVVAVDREGGWLTATVAGRVDRVTDVVDIRLSLMGVSDREILAPRDVIQWVEYEPIDSTDEEPTHQASVRRIGPRLSDDELLDIL